MIQYFFSTVFFLSSLFLHPIHVSVTDIEFNKEVNALQVTSHVFIDDMERQIRLDLDEPYLDITKPGKGRTSDGVIEPYFRKHFKLTINGKEANYNYLGHEVEAGAIYIYVEVTDVDKLDAIKVYNDILVDLYDDQVNMVHVKVDGKLRSLKLEEDNREDELVYEK